MLHWPAAGKAVLDDVGVLELVDEEVAVAVGVLFEGVGGAVEELDGLEEEVVEVDTVIVFKDGLVALEDPTHDLVEVAVDVKAVGLGVDHLTLVGGDCGGDGAWAGSFGCRR